MEAYFLRQKIHLKQKIGIASISDSIRTSMELALSGDKQMMERKKDLVSGVRLMIPQHIFNLLKRIYDQLPGGKP